MRHLWDTAGNDRIKKKTCQFEYRWNFRSFHFHQNSLWPHMLWEERGSPLYLFLSGAPLVSLCRPCNTAQSERGRSCNQEKHKWRILHTVQHTLKLKLRLGRLMWCVHCFIWNWLCWSSEPEEKNVSRYKWSGLPSVTDGVTHRLII